MKKIPAIELIGVNKTYEIHHDKPTLMEKIMKGKHETFQAIPYLDFTVWKGETVGLIGPNGSGKTTLLKMIAGITSPTSGKILRHGKVVSLIDLEAGFHEDLSGVQNIQVNGMLLGLSRTFIHSSLKSIIRFADIGNFIDVPLYTYSAGMKLRLGFAIAVHTNPDIIILDESMAVGDGNFYQKVRQKIQEFHRAHKTLVIASHNIPEVYATCSRIIHIEHGIIKKEEVRKNKNWETV